MLLSLLLSDYLPAFSILRLFVHFVTDVNDAPHVYDQVDDKDASADHCVCLFFLPFVQHGVVDTLQNQDWEGQSAKLYDVSAVDLHGVVNLRD